MIRQFLLMLLNGVPSEKVHEIAVDLANNTASISSPTGSTQRVITANMLHNLCYKHASSGRRKALIVAMVRTSKRTVQLWSPGKSEQAEARMERGAQA